MSPPTRNTQLHAEVVRQPSPVTSFLNQIPLGNKEERQPGHLCMQDQDHQASEYQGRGEAVHNGSNRRHYQDEQPSQALVSSSSSDTLNGLNQSSIQQSKRKGVHKAQQSTVEDRSSSYEPPSPFEYVVDLPATPTHLKLDKSRPYSGPITSRQPMDKIRTMKSQGSAEPGLQAINGRTYPDTKKVFYVDASTQTEPMEPPSKISSSRLANLQEEEAVAQFKHEAEMARRKEALALEWKHEHKMLQLRQRFEPSPAPPSVVALNNDDRKVNGGTAHVEVPRREIKVQDGEATIKGIAEQTANLGAPSVEVKSSTALSNGPTHDACAERAGPKQDNHKKISDLDEKDQAKGSAPGLNPDRQSITHKAREYPNEPLPTPRTISPRYIATALLSKLAEQPLNLDRQSSAQAELHAERGRRTTQGKNSESNQATIGSSARPKSSTSSSLRIKTSPSPARGYRDETRTDTSRWSTVKRLTCYFWYNGNCHKSAAECSYAHHDTGNIAMNPEQMRKRKREQDDLFGDDLYRPRGGYYQ
ncbi:MAG: hypothetical protein Q9218_005758 [Villophora microphyllina]